MLRNWLKAGLLATAIAATFVPSAAAAPPFPLPVPGLHAQVCPGPVRPGTARCHARVIVDKNNQPQTFSTPAGYSPSDLRNAYRISGTGSAATTIAIVDAYGYPNAESDLAVYRSKFGLPACSSATGCFAKVNQNGAASPLPWRNTGWAQESALDLDMASAMCPGCKLVLVEAKSTNDADLATAVNTAANVLHAQVISNSYGGGESGTTGFESAYNHPGVTIIASSGDNAYGGGVEFPASSPHVIAAGGTSLTRDTSTRGWSETAWSGAGSGCSSVYAKPTWQKDSGCIRRTVADVSAVANPNTGVAVYGPSYFGSAWMVFGGTSVAAPLIGGIYGSLGGTADPGSTLYANPSALNDVTAGSTGTCTPSYLCTAGPGYDGPTGLGTPNGSAAF